MTITGMLLSRRKVIQVAIEAVTKGTEAVTGFVDVIVLNPVIQPTAPFDERPGPGKNLGQSYVGLLGEKSGTFSCEVELRTGTSAGMEPGLAILLQACGFLKAAEVYTVTSIPGNHQSITIAVYQDGKKKVLYGAMGDVEFTGDVGKKVICKFDFIGIYKTPAAASLPTYAPTVYPPPILAAGQFKIGTPARKISKVGLNMNNKTILRMDANAASGIAYAVITDIGPVMTFDLESELVGDDDIYGQWLAGTTAAISLVLGITPHLITFAIPKLQYKAIPEGDREGLMIEDVEGQCMQSSLDGVADAVSITVS